MQPLLSIIIPAYNVEKYLEQCLDSVVQQDNGKIEVILVNDGSTDATWQICCGYAERYPFIRAFTKQNAGPSSARNFGIREANGKYLNFLDSDDYLDEHAIQNICSILEKNRPEMVIGRYRNLVEATGEITPCGYQLEQEKVEALSGEQLLKYLITGRVYDWYSYLMVFETGFILSHSFFFDENAIFGEDARWVPNVILHAQKVSYLDEPFYIYRRNRTGSITATFSRRTFFNKLELLDFIERFSKANALSQETERLLYCNMSNMYVSALFETWSFQKDERKQYLLKLKKYKFILAHSPRSYHRLLNTIWTVFGETFVSYLLYLRAQWVRKKKIK